ncbi:hypothetical protein ACFRCI_01305 [Streptomyces sp. NPDC056638]|uniref:hypothetical protein n=1 Tax=Streptomyces sp. NPDC056638 TaxID=3345887 RepID=UPI00369B7150
MTRKHLHDFSRFGVRKSRAHDRSNLCGCREEEVDSTMPLGWKLADKQPFLTCVRQADQAVPFGSLPPSRVVGPDVPLAEAQWARIEPLV